MNTKRSVYPLHFALALLSAMICLCGRAETRDIQMRQLGIAEGLTPCTENGNGGASGKSMPEAYPSPERGDG